MYCATAIFLFIRATKTTSNKNIQQFSGNIATYLFFAGPQNFSAGCAQLSSYAGLKRVIETRAGTDT